MRLPAHRSDFLEIVAISQLVAGSVGVVAMIWLSFTTPALVPWGSIELAVLPFGLIATAGVRMLLRTPDAYHLSATSQLIQAFFGSVHSVVWKCCAGPYFFIVTQGGRVNLSAGVDVSLLVGRQTSQSFTTFGINVVPILTLYLLYRLRAAVG